MEPSRNAGTFVTPGSVLVVDDDEALRMLVIRWLAKAGLSTIEARSGQEAIEKALATPDEIDAIVCDVMMPGLTGLDVVRHLKEDARTSSIPLVLLTAHATSDLDIVHGVEAGAVDHLVKPFSGPVLVAKVRAICERTRAERALRNKLRFAEEHASVDLLTGLFNRHHFEGRLRAEASHALRHKRPFSVVMFDLDHFKSYNDTFGHAGGDRVLRHVADLLRALVRGDDLAFRYGGEEFVLLLRACDRASAVAVADRLRAELRARPILLGESREPRIVTFSAGVASAEESNAFDAAAIVERADAALYRAKRTGRDRIDADST